MTEQKVTVKAHDGRPWTSYRATGTEVSETRVLIVNYLTETGHAAIMFNANEWDTVLIEENNE